jgi:hypothetical protein
VDCCDVGVVIVIPLIVEVYMRICNIGDRVSVEARISNGNTGSPNVWEDGIVVATLSDPMKSIWYKLEVRKKPFDHIVDEGWPDSHSEIYEVRSKIASS